MMTNAFVLETTTYDQLSEVLAELGFQKHIMPQFTAYRNARFDALIVLPLDTLTEQVRPLHLAAARATVVGKGVGTADAFDRLLIEVSRNTDARGVSTEKAILVAGPKKRAQKTVAPAARMASANQEE